MDKPVDIAPRTKAGSYLTFDRRYQPIAVSDGVIDRRYDDPLILDADERLVWTLIEAEGKTYIMPGFLTVNFMGRVLCKLPWSDAEQASPGYLY